MASQPQISTQSQPGRWNPAIDSILRSGAAIGPSRLEKSVRQIRKRDPSLSLRRLMKRTAELGLTSWNTPWSESDKSFVLRMRGNSPCATSHDAWEEHPELSTYCSCGREKVRNSRMDIPRHNSLKHSMYRAEKFDGGFVRAGSCYIGVG